MTIQGASPYMEGGISQVAWRLPTLLRNLLGCRNAPEPRPRQQNPTAQRTTVVSLNLGGLLLYLKTD